MYKVFINNKLICLQQNTDKIGDEANFHNFTSVKILKKIIRQFKNDKNKKLIITHNSAEELWKIFKSVFREVEAAGGMVKNSKGEYLFIFRRGKWDLPKGKLKRKEEITDAALREVNEECGINDLKIIRVLNPTYHIYFRRFYKVLKKTYWFEMFNATDENPTPQLTEDITKAEWKRKEDFNKIFENTYELVKEVVEFCVKKVNG
ncbi:MAG: NUDIX domain-containing protein [Bacteroidales bacterium]|nr:NUDIX domain-containing protein [Bacteroidales bacterium]